MVIGTETIDERSLGKQVFDGAKYVGKNFWKALPMGSAINYEIQREKEIMNEAYKEDSIQYELFRIKDIVQRTLHGFYAIAGTLLLGVYLFGAIPKGELIPKQIKEYNKKMKKTEQVNQSVKQSELEKSVK